MRRTLIVLSAIVALVVLGSAPVGAAKASYFLNGGNVYSVLETAGGVAVRLHVSYPSTEWRGFDLSEADFLLLGDRHQATLMLGRPPSLGVEEVASKEISQSADGTSITVRVGHDTLTAWRTRDGSLALEANGFRLKEPEAIGRILSDMPRFANAFWGLAFMVSDRAPAPPPVFPQVCWSCFGCAGAVIGWLGSYAGFSACVPPVGVVGCPVAIAYHLGAELVLIGACGACQECAQQPSPGPGPGDGDDNGECPPGYVECESNPDLCGACHPCTGDCSCGSWCP